MNTDSQQTDSTDKNKCDVCDGEFPLDKFDADSMMCFKCYVDYECENSNCKERREGATEKDLCGWCEANVAKCRGETCAEYLPKEYMEKVDYMWDFNYYCSNCTNVCENCEYDVSEWTNVSIECMRNPEGEDVTWCRECFETNYKEAAQEGWTWCDDHGKYVDPRLTQGDDDDSE